MPTQPILALARTMGNPVIDENTATLVWQGSSSPLVISDLHDWELSPQKMVRAGSSLWTLSMSLPEDAYLEYAFIDPKNSKRIIDPLNPNRVFNGINDYNHYFYMPYNRSNSLATPRKHIEKGGISQHSIKTLDYVVGKKRTIYLYQPPVKSPVPLLFVYDGSDYLRRAKLNIIVDNLISERSIQPIAIAFIPTRRISRTVEYSCSESTLNFLTECVLPVARENLNLQNKYNEPFGILGASLGGSMALFTALRLPKLFRKVLSQSGAFIAPDFHSIVVDLVRYLPPDPNINIWMDVGRFEGLLDGNRKMVNFLKGKNYQTKYREYSGGHNFTSWRNDIWRGLEALYPANMLN